MRVWRLGVGMVFGLATLVPLVGQSLEADLQRAIQAQMATGDCRTAIEDYRKIVARAGTTNRAVAAQALIQIAECQRKLGDDEARRTYEQVLAEYADQKDTVAVARGRIAPPTTRISNRLVWEIPDGAFFWGHASPDGRYVVYGNTEVGDLYLRDLVAGTSRRLTSDAKAGTPPSRADAERYGDDFTAVSRDGRQVAYAWNIGRGATYREELRLVNSAGPSGQSAKLLLKGDDIRGVTPFDWSPDGRSIAIGIWRRDRTDTELALLSVADGSVTHVKSVPENSGDALGSVFFSPDGGLLAINPDREAGDSAREIILIDLVSGAEHSLMPSPGHDKMLGWSPDGGIAFVSRRTGSEAIWYAPVEDGTPGAARPLDVAPFAFDDSRMWRMGISTDGSLYYRLFPSSSTDVKVAAFDFATGRFESAPANATTDLVGLTRRPVLSPDGRYLAFQTRRPAAGIEIVVRDMVSGALSELRTSFTVLADLQWAPDGSALAASASIRGGPIGVYRIDARTREVEAVSPSASDTRFRQWSADGRKIYFDRSDSADDVRVIERDLASGAEREIHRGAGRGAWRFKVSPDGRTFYYRRPASLQQPGDLVAKNLLTGAETVLLSQRLVGVPFLSPDGRFIATPLFAANAGTNAGTTLLLVPTDGSPARDLGSGYGIQAWSSDSRTILAQRWGTGDYWQFAIDGGEPRRIDFPNSGRQRAELDTRAGWLAWTEWNGLGPGPADASELWVLENFLPRPGGGRGAGGR